MRCYQWSLFLWSVALMGSSAATEFQRRVVNVIDSVQCPKCNGPSHVLDSRDEETARRRRRQCDNCHHRYTTYEIHADEYNRIRKLEPVIATLIATANQFGATNGSAKD